MALNERIYEGHHIPLNVGTGVLSGAPVAWGTLVGVCHINADANGVAVVDIHGGVYNLTVNGVNAGGNVAVSAGDTIYYTSGDTIKLSKKATGVPFGIALGTDANPTPAAAAQLLAGTGVSGTLRVKLLTS